jgi:hypothetical protein
LVANWLAIEVLPDSSYFYDFKGAISHGDALGYIRISAIPVTGFNRGFLSFAPLPQLQEYFGPTLELIAERLTMLPNPIDN